MSDERREEDERAKTERYLAYLDAIDLPNSRRLDTPEGIADWVQHHQFELELKPEDPLCIRLSHMVKRMLRVVDFISGWTAPLDENRKQRRDIERGREWIKKLLEANPSLIQVRWGGAETLEGMRSLEERVTNAIEKHLLWWHLPDRPNSYEMFAGGYEFLPTFGVFPFFLLDERKLNWDVIQFGVQRKVGLMMAREVAREVFDIDIQDEPASLAARAAGPPVKEIDKHALEEGIHRARRYNRHKFLFLGVGHAAFKIILAELDHAKYFEFRSILKDVPSLLKAAAQPCDAHNGDKWFSKQVCSMIQRDHEGTRYILVSDPGDYDYNEIIQYHQQLASLPARRRRGAAVADLRRFELVHHQQIPVGIGFSLCCVPRWLKQPEMFADIAAAIRGYLDENPRFLKALAVEGVSVERSHIKELKKLAKLRPSPPRTGEEAGPGVAKRDLLVKDMADMRYAGIARLIKSGTVDEHVGMGVAVDRRHVLTCAHVVNDALSRLAESREPPDKGQDKVHVVFPYSASKKPISGGVQIWKPVGTERLSDVAVVELDEDIPEDVRMPSFSCEQDLHDLDFVVFGVTSKDSLGGIVKGQIKGYLPNKNVELKGSGFEDIFIAKGFSGAAVWSPRFLKSVGIVSQKKGDASVQVAYMIPASLLKEAWPHLPDSNGEERPQAHRAASNAP